MPPLGALGCRETAHLAALTSPSTAEAGYRAVRRVIASNIEQLGEAGIFS
jgi:hypothetical protein